MQSREGFVLASYGDPESRKTWSGTPYNLMTAFRRLGYPVSGINSLTDNNLVKASQLAVHKVRYPTTNFRIGPVARGHSAGRVVRAASGFPKVLHTSLYHLPLRNPPPGQEQYLYLDFTWDLEMNSGFDPTQGDPPPFSKDGQVVEDLNKAAYAQMTHFFCISDFVRDNLVRHYRISPEKITVVGTGINMEFLQPVPPKDYTKREILFSSKIIGGWEYKGGALLLEAFQLARQQVPDLKLTLVGLDEYAERAKDVPGVTAHGYVSWEELLALFRGATLFAMPALREPWGLVYLEALACQTPILGLNRLAFPEISGHGQYGFMAAEATPKAVAQAIVEAVSDPKRLQKMGEAGRKRCQDHFTWDHVATTIAGKMGIAPTNAE